MAGYTEGTKVAWDWGEGTAEGEIVKIYTRKITVKIKGTDVTREASDDQPAYLLKQEDGDEVLKAHSEVRKAG